MSSVKPSNLNIFHWYLKLKLELKLVYGLIEIFGMRLALGSSAEF